MENTSLLLVFPWQPPVAGSCPAGVFTENTSLLLVFPWQPPVAGSYPALRAWRETEDRLNGVRHDPCLAVANLRNLPLPLGEAGRRPGEGAPESLKDAGAPSPSPLPEGEGERQQAHPHPALSQRERAKEAATAVPNRSRTGFSLSVTSTGAAFTNREVATATSLLCAGRSSALASPQMEKQTSSQDLPSVPQRRLAAAPQVVSGENAARRRLLPPPSNATKAGCSHGALNETECRDGIRFRMKRSTFAAHAGPNRIESVSILFSLPIHRILRRFQHQLPELQVEPAAKLEAGLTDGAAAAESE